MESFIIGGVCLLHVAHRVLRAPEPPQGPRRSYELFTSLPYTLQEDIIDFLPIPSICAVNRTSRYFNAVSTRAFYKHAVLRRTPEEENDAFGLPILRYEQRTFIATVISHPRHARWVQSLHWEMISAAGDMCLAPSTLPPRRPAKESVWQRDFGTDVWRAFRRLKSLKELEFQGGKWPHTLPWSSPHKPLFPALRCAVIRGVLPYKALDVMLHTSTVLQELQLLDYPCEQSPDAMSTIKTSLTSLGHKYTECVSIGPFLQRSIGAGAFRNLRIFHFVAGKDAPDAAPRLTPAEMRPFLDYLSDSLEVLVITVQDRAEEWGEMLSDTLLSGNWRQLRKLVIGLPVSRHISHRKEKMIVKACPQLDALWRSHLQMNSAGKWERIQR